MDSRGCSEDWDKEKKNSPMAGTRMGNKFWINNLFQNKLL
jgi:hypothetical protein